MTQWFSDFTKIRNTSNTHGKTDAMELTRSHISLSDIKTDILSSSHTSSLIFNSYIYIYIISDRIFRRLPALVKIRFLWLHKSLVNYLPFFLCFFVHIVTLTKTGGGVRVSNSIFLVQYLTKKISNEIPSIFSPLIFSHYLFLPLIFIFKFRIINSPEHILEQYNNLFLIGNIKSSS